MSDDEHNPYAPPSPVYEPPARGRSSGRAHSEDGGIAWFEEGHVWLPRYAGQMPDRCVVCNRPTDFKQIKQVLWHPPIIYILMCLGWLPYLIVASMMRKAATIFIPLCYEHERRRKNGQVILWSGLGIGVALIIFGSVLNLGWLSAFALVGLLIALVVGSTQSRVISVTRIDDTHVHFTASIEFMESLPRSPDEEPAPLPKKKKKKKAAKKPKPTEESEDTASQDTESSPDDTDSPNDK